MPPKGKLPGIIAVELKEADKGDVNSGQASERIKLNVKLENGEVVKGFYTANVYVDYEQRYQDLLDEKIREVKEKDPDNAAGIELLEKLKKENDLHRFFIAAYTVAENEDNWSYVKAHGGFMGDNDATKRILSIALPNDEKNIDKYSAAFESQEFAIIMNDLGPSMMQLGVKNQINVNQVGAEENRNLNRRNNGMYEVSKLLGHEDLICQSVRMATMDEDNNQIDGTFMVNAKGTDLEDIKAIEDDDGNEIKLTYSAEAKRDLSRFQVLDFICGNIDRHSKNFFYQTRLTKQDNGGYKYEVVGLQGIDNDASFGTIQGDGNVMSFYMSNIGDIKVIDRDQANHVLSLTPEAFEKEMRKIGLGREEVAAGLHRLELIQTKIKTGKDIKIMENLDDWGKLNPAALETSLDQNHDNIWGLRKDVNQILAKQTFNRRAITPDEYERRERAQAKPPRNVKQAKNESLKLLFQSQIDELSEIMEEFNKTNPEKASKEFDKLYKGFGTLIENLKIASEKEELTDNEFNYINENFKYVEDLSKYYVKKKPKNPVTENGKIRLHAAKNLGAQLEDARNKVLDITTVAKQDRVKGIAEKYQQIAIIGDKIQSNPKEVSDKELSEFVETTLVFSEKNHADPRAQVASAKIVFDLQKELNERGLAKDISTKQLGRIQILNQRAGNAKLEIERIKNAPMPEKKKEEPVVEQDNNIVLGPK